MKSENNFVDCIIIIPCEINKEIFVGQPHAYITVCICNQLTDILVKPFSFYCFVAKFVGGFFCVIGVTGNY